MEPLAEDPRGSREELRHTLDKYATFDLKGVMASVTVMRLRSTDLYLAQRQLRTRVLQFPQFFDKSMLVLDLSPLGAQAVDIPLDAVARMLRGCGVVPAGVTGIDESLLEQMDFSVLPLVNVGRQGRIAAAPPRPREPETPAAQAAPAKPAAQPGAAHAGRPQYIHVTKPPLVIHQQVRSGQQINAPGTDLIVMAPVNPGAQLVADGHIHIYGPMRGRAFAGASGYTPARIFCQKLDAEMVAIAGAYVMADDIPREHRNQPVQVFVEDGECKFAAL